MSIIKMILYNTLKINKYITGIIYSIAYAEYICHSR